MQLSRENLQASIEELETSNEELQSTNEELESSNEELQSTNEELQSVNEELYTVNTEYQKKIVELTELNDDLDNFLHGTNIATLFLDHDLCIRKFTPAMAEVVQLLPHDVGRSIEHFATPLAYEGLSALVKQVQETGKLQEHEVRGRKGQWLMMRVLPYETKNKEFAGVVMTFTDVSRIKQKEEELSQFTASLERSNQDLQQFAYVVSHDLQEPLRMVSSYCRLLQDRYRGQLDTHGNEFLAYAMDGATRMQGLIDGLLSYSRIHSRGKPLIAVACAIVVQQALSNLKVAIEEARATITMDTLPTVRGDAAQLLQLFQNLLSNAIKFRGHASPVVHIDAMQHNDMWRFAIRDNGIGISQTDTTDIFGIFRRLHTRQEYAGSGLGLAMCKRIVERHEGKIWVESHVGQGSTFFFTLPADHVAEQSPSAHPAEPNDTRNS
ncbi:MAG: hypothetical protein FJ147_20540 [Deltaproteobacteria bacterium]|nr:hypothetical protein [Deltaproteobacteria bacterium]